MSTPRFYYPAKLALGAIVTLPENAAIHACRALRLQVGDAATLFNGDGYDYGCELLFIKKNTVTAKVKTLSRVDNESPLKVTLAQAISSSDRMEALAVDLTTARQVVDQFGHDGFDGGPQAGDRFRAERLVRQLAQPGMQRRIVEHHPQRQHIAQRLDHLGGYPPLALDERADAVG